LNKNGDNEKQISRREVELEAGEGLLECKNMGQIWQKKEQNKVL